MSRSIRSVASRLFRGGRGGLLAAGWAGLTFASIVSGGILLTGCGGASDPGSGAGATGVTGSDGIKQYTAARLPLVLQELPPLDGGRIEIPTPAGWTFAPQSKGMITRFHLQGRTGIPQIIIRVEEAAGAPETIDRQNVVAYAAQVQSELDAQVTAKKTTLLEPAKPMLLGTQPWVRYVVPGKLPDKQRATLERQILRTVHRGRMYTIDLTVDANELPQHRDHAYAIAAGIKFLAMSEAAPAPAEGANSNPAEPMPPPNP